MAIKITNNTPYKTKQVRTLVRATIMRNDVPGRIGRPFEYDEYAPRNLNSIVNIPRQKNVPDTVRSVALVVALIRKWDKDLAVHDIQLYSWATTWAQAYKLDIQPKPKFTDVRAKRAQTLLRKWKTRLKRAQTMVRKYMKLVKYYDKKKTTQRIPQVPTKP